MLNLKYLRETKDTVTFEILNDNATAVGYRFFVNDRPVAVTLDPTRNEVKFSKPSLATKFGVASLTYAEAVSTMYPEQAVPTNQIQVNNTITPSELLNLIMSKSGPVEVVPKGSQFRVTDGFDVPKADVTFRNAVFDGIVNLNDKTKIYTSTAQGFNAFGVSDWILDGNVFDGKGNRNQNLMWDVNGRGCKNWSIKGNAFRNFYVSDPTVHAEALFVGGLSENGVIDGNMFYNNGNTSHIFFTWFGNIADPNRSYPRNILVKNNSFDITHGAYFAINFRDELSPSQGIRVERNSNKVINGVEIALVEDERYLV